MTRLIPDRRYLLAKSSAGKLSHRAAEITFAFHRREKMELCVGLVLFQGVGVRRKNMEQIIPLIVQCSTGAFSLSWSCPVLFSVEIAVRQRPSVSLQDFSPVCTRVEIIVRPPKICRTMNCCTAVWDWLTIRRGIKRTRNLEQKVAFLHRNFLDVHKCSLGAVLIRPLVWMAIPRRWRD